MDKEICSLIQQSIACKGAAAVGWASLMQERRTPGEGADHSKSYSLRCRSLVAVSDAGEEDARCVRGYDTLAPSVCALIRTYEQAEKGLSRGKTVDWARLLLGSYVCLCTADNNNVVCCKMTTMCVCAAHTQGGPATLL